MSWLLAMLMALLFRPSAPEPSAGDGAGQGGVTIPLSAPSEPPTDLPPVTRARGSDPPLVVIDPGHGGRDPGASSEFAGEEKDITLALARAIRDELARSGRVRAALTRDDDTYLVLQDRYEIARRLQADLFISIHADAAPLNDAARGATVYTLSEVASDRQAALLAQRENEADLLAGVRMSANPNVNMILIDLAQRESMDVASEFARLLHREAAPIFPFRPDWHRFAAFVVLKAPDIPSILFESGYVTNRADADYIRSAEGRQQIATGMRRAIEAHFAERFLRRES